MPVEARLTDHAFEPAEELRSFVAALTDEGGVVSFVGVARPSSRTGDAVERLFLDHHPRLTGVRWRRSPRTRATRFDVTAVRVVHRCGEVPAGEPIVFAAAAAVHRRAAFEAADYLMDRLKTDAVFWKREEGIDGAAWIEPTRSGSQRIARAGTSRCPESTKR